MKAPDAHQRHAKPGRQRAQTVDTEPGRITGKGTVYMRVAHSTPAKTAEPGASGQFSQHPESRKNCRCRARGTRPDCDKSAAGRCIKQCHQSGKGKDSQQRERGWQAAIGIQGDKNPTHRSAHPGQRKQPAQPGGLTPVPASLQQQRQQHHCQYLEPPDRLTSAQSQAQQR